MADLIVKRMEMGTIAQVGGIVQVGVDLWGSRRKCHL